MNINNIPIGQRLVSGFGILILITFITGIVAVLQIRSLADITTKIYRHPLAVSCAVRDVRADIIAMHRSMKDVALAENNTQIDAASAVVNLCEKRVYKNFDIALDRFLGEKTKVEIALQSFKDWKAIRDEVILLSSRGEKKKAAAITKGIGAKHVELMATQIQIMIDFAGAKAAAFSKDTMQKEKEIKLLLFGTLVALIVFGVFISLLITRSITAPLGLIVQRIESIAAGDLSQSLTFKSRGEIGILADAFRELQKNLLLSVQAAEKIAELDFSNEITPRSENDHLGRSFNAMTTSLRAAVKNFKESDERYRILFNSESDAIFVVDVETLAVLEANEAAIKLYGYSLEELLEKKAPELSAEPDKTVVTLTKEYETEVPMRLHRKKDGTVFPVEIAANYITLKDRMVNVSAIRDISRRITMEEEKKNMESLVRQSQKMEAIGTLAGGIAHDFNNMLGVITGNISYVLSLLSTDNELYEPLTDVLGGAKQAQGLTQQLLTFAKGGEPVKKIVALNRLVQETTGFVTRGSGIKCDFKLAEKIWLSDIDEGQINQVLSNILINASQAMPDGGTIHISTENTDIEPGDPLPLDKGRYIRIAIGDNGIGISEKHLPMIFDPYFSTKQKGSGLGLATSYSIVKKHGGHIAVESEPDKGTVLYIYLPAHEGDFANNKISSSHHIGKGKILVMDDDVSILKMAVRLLSKMGYQIDTVQDGDAAINRFKDALGDGIPFDLVILDLTIPGGMGGKETIAALLKLSPELNALVSSGYSNDPVMSNFREYGFKGIVPKPYTRDELSTVLNTVFRAY